MSNSTQTLDTPIQYRLYYDDSGAPVTYSVGYFTEDDPGPEGNYIVIDQFEFLCKRYDLKVIEGKIVSLSSLTVISKYAPGPGLRCAKEDISIVVDEDYTDYIEWGLIHSGQ